MPFFCHVYQGGAMVLAGLEGPIVPRDFFGSWLSLTSHMLIYLMLRAAERSCLGPWLTK